MRRLSLIFVCIILLAPATIRAAEGYADFFKAFNWGIKFGFGARATDMQTLVIDGHAIKDFTKDNQVGHCTTAFVRYNAKQTYYQAEGSFMHSRTAIAFDRNSWNQQSVTPSEATFSTDGKTLRGGITAGYRFVQMEPYTMSVYTGPAVEHTISGTAKTEFSGFGADDLSEKITAISAVWRIGLECTIGKALFCFEYQRGLNNISKGIYNDDTGLRNDQITLDRVNSMLSFSVGMIF